jgi:hypothetical protein
VTEEGYSSSQLSEVHHEKPNPQPLPYKGRGARIKASLLLGERFGERSDCISFNREELSAGGDVIRLISARDVTDVLGYSCSG